MLAASDVSAPAVTEYGLPARALQALRLTLSQNPYVERAVLYGSRAKGNFRPGSDIDITLEGSALSYSDLLRIDLALDDLMLPYKIDLSLLAHIDNPALRDHIARVGKVLWQNPDLNTKPHARPPC